MGLLSGRTLAVLAVLVLAVLPAVGAAQSGNTTATATPTATPGGTENVTRSISIDRHVTVVDYRYDGGTMIVELDSTARVPLEVADLFGSIPTSGGASRVDGRTVTIGQGRTVVRVPAEPFNGLAVVTVAAPGGTVTLAERVSSPLLGGPWTASDARAAGLGGLVSAFVLVGGYGLRKVRGIATSPERLI